MKTDELKIAILPTVTNMCSYSHCLLNLVVQSLQKRQCVIIRVASYRRSTQPIIWTELATDNGHLLPAAVASNNGCAVWGQLLKAI